eukprot:CAMPEP_0119004376 /NCGR_PEP_ID=MMETSP1176-20130426/1105_1 /TAXON_ID=265551 /ORGANISM="Synedropsis recta cf, Strain CCMP1620" /LENGTH=450 /DNA_ID=CAMNT_0006956071 /DNA_START=149 /DNA_END=1501 /DNA_ORIENTATION=+
MNPSDTVGADRTPMKHLERPPVKKMTKKNKTKYKKAPQAPRRFKSAYMFFSTSKHKEIREELGSRGIVEKTTNIAKLVSVAWKELDPEERERWEELARQDKARFEVEKSLYTGPWKVPAKKKSQKDPNAPKRPMSAFLAYSHARRAEVKKKNANMNNAEISRVLASMWKGAPEEEKKEHIDKEYKLRQKYLTEIAIWRENTEKELSEQRRHREEIAMKTVQARGGPAAIQEEMAQQHNQAYEKEGGSQSQGAYPGYYPPPHQYYGGPAQDYRGSQYPPTPYSYQSSSQYQQSQQPPYDQQARPPESQQQEAYQNGEYYPPNYGYYPPPSGTPGYPPSGHEHYPTNGYGANYGEYPSSSQPGQNAYNTGYYDQQAPYPPPTAAQEGATSEGYDRGGQYAQQPGYSYGDNDTRDSKPAAVSADHHRSDRAPRGGREEEGGGQPLANGIKHSI